MGLKGCCLFCCTFNRILYRVLEQQVNTLGITVCIGIDKAENGYLVTKRS